MTADAYTGYTVLGETISIGRLPGRKSYALYVTLAYPWVDADGKQHTGSSLRALAYFTSDEDARIGIRLLDLLAESTRIVDRQDGTP